MATMKWVAVAIVVAALILAGAMVYTHEAAATCDNNPFTSTPSCAQ